MAEVELNIKVQIAELQKDLKNVQESLKKLDKQTEETQKSMQQNMQGTSKAVKSVGTAFVAAFAIKAVTKLTKSIIAVRTEFEKYRAILTNTMGSAGAANKEFDKIQKFALETPFALKTLTDAFVRLVNQGFKPTMKQMRLLGDLAASSGKDFIQLTEAIIDAQTGEFERLQQFGIMAKKEGDKITFTFREQTTQVAFTSKAIREYILSLGELEGISGAMAVVSETLGGQIDILRDKWVHLLDVMGEKTEGVFSWALEKLNELLDGITTFTERSDATLRGRKKGQGIIQQFILGEDDAGEVIRDFEAIDIQMRLWISRLIRLDHEIGQLTERSFGTDASGKFISKGAFNDKLKALKEQREEWLAVIDVLREVSKENVKIDDEQKVETVTLETLRKKLVELEKAKQKFNVADEKGLSILSRQIWGLKSLIKTLSELGDPTKIKPLDLGENLKFDEDAIFGKATEDVYKEQKKQKDDFDSWYWRQEEDRFKDFEQKEQEKQLWIEGTFAVASSFADLLLSMNQTAMNKELENAEGNAKKQEEIRKKYAKKQQAMSIVQAIISGAEGIVKTGSQLGYPLAIPFQIALGLQTLAQIALIRGQKFEKGGFDVLKGRRHAQGGVDIGIGEAEAGEGLAVFNRTATQKYGKFLPAFVKAINENNGDLGYSDGAYMISFDDSKSVKELKGINEKLSRPEIRYEGRYRIETRKGQTTRVRI